MVTVEELPDGPLQQAFWEKHALQCGFCTPGLLITAFHFLQDNPCPTRDEMRLPGTYADVPATRILVT
ncbi:2Fe-2S iron-sulfur cluster-binding protein [Marinithermofilum abyssi]|uniref:2Fe-2S iron-sulfur cluster-binding protein n=1 Tax=Marinithermofilum abyssi TaxID=1571185 RepID=UPI0027E45659|nr:2Fe-2S iron-sulfur cluster-binding protein [Marinithermofilum abyssi]